MSKYEDLFGTVMTEEEARDDMHEKMDIFDYLNYLSVDFNEVLEWCFSQPDFYERFSNELTSAENEYFTDHYVEIEDEEDDE